MNTNSRRSFFKNTISTLGILGLSGISHSPHVYTLTPDLDLLITALNTIAK